MRTKKFNNKGKQKRATTTQHDLGYDSGVKKRSQLWGIER